MKQLKYLSLIVALAAGPTTDRAEAQTRSPKSSDVIRVVENSDEAPSVVVLTNGQRFQTTLYEVKALGALRTKGKIPFLVLSGRGCMECDANISIYIHSPSDGAMKGEGGQRRFGHPGRLVSYEDDKTLMSETRTFIGSCLNNYDDAVVWFDRYRSAQGRFESAVLIVRVGSDDAIEQIRPTGSLPLITAALQRVGQGVCRELPRIVTTTEP
jgi:hypothetical protein